MNINKVIVVGNITRDPEIRQPREGFTVASFSVATNRKWKDRDGMTQEEVEYHNIVAHNKQAELASAYLHRGDQVGIEGRLKTDEWVDKETGEKRRKTNIVVDRIEFGRKAGTAGIEEQPQAPTQEQVVHTPAAAAPAAAPAAPAHDPQKLQDDIDSIFPGASKF